MRLEGRVALVTGGGKGIGAHYVQALAGYGAKVAAADIDQAAAESTAARLTSEGGAEVIGLPIDVADEASVQRAVAQTVQRFGRLDILVNNAALYSVLMPKRKFWEETAEATRLSQSEFLASLAEPPEVLSSMEAFLVDRRDFDPDTWDVDQERAARAQVEQKHAGHVALVTRPATLRGVVDSMYRYQPRDVLEEVRCPMLVLVAESGAARSWVAG